MQPDYRNLQPEELATDPSFRLWKISNDAEQGTFWQTWLSENPDKQELINKASHLLDTVFNSFDAISDDEVTTEIHRLSFSLGEKNAKASRPVFLLRPEWYSVAASVLMIIGFGWWFINKNSPAEKTNLLYKEIISQIKEPLIQEINNTDKPKLVALSDGSSVLLQPKSRISYPKSFKELNVKFFFMVKRFLK